MADRLRGGNRDDGLVRDATSDVGDRPATTTTGPYVEVLERL
ncbi:MAG TPA: hypothetical protein VK923_08135 [Euzebyales bacterium]|nr:hypothetical protein [Euzebyales bacterium]